MRVANNFYCQTKCLHIKYQKQNTFTTRIKRFPKCGDLKFLTTKCHPKV